MTDGKLRHAALCIREKMDDGRLTQWQVARAIGIHSTDLSRLLNANTRRRWGYWRLERVVRWLGISLDEMLGRPEGTTRPTADEREPVVQAGLQMRMLVTKAGMLRYAEGIAGLKTNLRRNLETTLPGGTDIDRLMSVIEEYVEGRLELERGLAEKAL